MLNSSKSLRKNVFPRRFLNCLLRNQTLHTHTDRKRWSSISVFSDQWSDVSSKPGRDESIEECTNFTSTFVGLQIFWSLDLSFWTISADFAWNFLKKRRETSQKLYKRQNISKKRVCKFQNVIKNQFSFGRKNSCWYLLIKKNIPASFPDEDRPFMFS